MPSDEEVVRGWLSFRELEDRLPMQLNPAPTSYAVMAEHSDTPWWRRDKLDEFIARDPHNLLLMYETGLDFMEHGTVRCVVLPHLPHYLLKVRGQIPADASPFDHSELLEGMFLPEAESDGLRILRETRQRRDRDRK